MQGTSCHIGTTDLADIAADLERAAALRDSDPFATYGALIAAEARLSQALSFWREEIDRRAGAVGLLGHANALPDFLREPLEEGAPA